jgi:hypothetical protein
MNCEVFKDSDQLSHAWQEWITSLIEETLTQGPSFLSYSPVAAHQEIHLLPPLHLSGSDKLE